MTSSAQNLSMQNGSRMPAVKSRSFQLCIICQFLHLSLLSLCQPLPITVLSSLFADPHPCQSHACLSTFRKRCFLYLRCSSRTLPISTYTPLVLAKTQFSQDQSCIPIPKSMHHRNPHSPTPTFLREQRCCNPWSSIWKPLPEQLSLLLVPESYKHKPSLLHSLTSPALERSPHSCLGKARPPTGKALTVKIQDRRDGACAIPLCHPGFHSWLGEASGPGERCL